MHSKLIDRDIIDITPWCIRLQPAAAMSEELKQYQNHKGRIDFGDTDSLNAYNKAAFKVMADIDLIIPEKNLVPTACLRQAYITILAEIIPKGSQILEIGTGATAVISMLAARNHGYHVIATEIDPESYKYAKMNIENNNLQNSITLVKSDGGIIDEILDKMDQEIENIQAVLCYPPTYPEEDREVYQNPDKVTGFKGTESEMIGGGVDGYEFIEKYLNEAIDSEIKYITVLLIFKDHAELAENQLKRDGKMVHKIVLKAGTRERYLIVSY